MSESDLDFGVVESTQPKQKSKFGLYGTIGFGAVAVAVSALALPFVTPALRKHTLPYVPATQQQINNVFKAVEYITKQNGALKAATSTRQDSLKLIDLGSGDGRIVFEAAKRGYTACGVEINTILYVHSLVKSFQQRGQFKIKPRFFRKNLWNVNMNDYDVIVVFGVQEMMKDLAQKLDNEIKPTTKIVSCRFPINEYKSIYALDDGHDSVWIYDKQSFQFLNKTA